MKNEIYIRLKLILKNNKSIEDIIGDVDFKIKHPDIISFEITEAGNDYDYYE